MNGQIGLLGIHPGSPGPGGRGTSCHSHPGRSIFSFELDRSKKDAEKGTDLRTIEKVTVAGLGNSFIRVNKQNSHFYNFT